MKQTIEKQVITAEIFAKCLLAAQAEGFDLARLYASKSLGSNALANSLLGTVMARIAWEQFSIEPPADVRIYSDQFTVNKPTPKANAVYGAALRAAYWPAYDEKRSMSEGWLLAATNDRLEIQRYDAHTRFASDVYAHQFVVRKALKGSVYHVAMLTLVTQ